MCPPPPPPPPPPPSPSSYSYGGMRRERHLGTARPVNSLKLRPKLPFQKSDNQGLAPQVKSRPPAAPTKDPSLIIDDSFLMEDADDILNCSFSINSLSPTDKAEEDKMDTERAHSDSHTKDKLLSLRKEYKMTSVSLAKAKAHHSLMSSCKDKLQTPRGLQIKVHCSAFLTDLSNIKKKITQNAQKLSSELDMKKTRHHL